MAASGSPRLFGGLPLFLVDFLPGIGFYPGFFFRQGVTEGGCDRQRRDGLGQVLERAILPARGQLLPLQAI